MEKYKYYSEDLGLEKRGIRKRNEEYIKDLKNLSTNEQTELRQRMVINNLPLALAILDRWDRFIGFSEYTKKRVWSELRTTLAEYVMTDATIPEQSSKSLGYNLYNRLSGKMKKLFKDTPTDALEYVDRENNIVLDFLRFPEDNYDSLELTLDNPYFIEFLQETLTEREIYVLKELTIKESDPEAVSINLGLSKSRVFQIRDKVLEKLGKWKDCTRSLEKKLKDIEIKITSHGYSEKVLKERKQLLSLIKLYNSL